MTVQWAGWPIRGAAAMDSMKNWCVLRTQEHVNLLKEITQILNDEAEYENMSPLKDLTTSILACLSVFVTA